MSRLQQDPGGDAPAPPAGVVATDIRYGGGIEPPRREWFLRGTEMAELDAAPAASLKPRIQSPPPGLIVGLDPDIPVDRQQLLFRAEPESVALRFELDGRPLAGAGHPYFWRPRPGRHVLRLLDGRGAEQDRLSFSVRGPPQKLAGAPAPGHG